MAGGLVIGDLGDEAYKYLGVLKSDKIKMEELKLKVRQDYYKKSQESSRNKLEWRKHV